MRWVQRFVPEFEKRWNRFARKAGRSWRVDETYVKVRGKWTYLYRAVDREAQTVDFRLSAIRDVKAAKAFFRKALKTQGRPTVSITLDGYAASHRAVREVPEQSPRWKDTRLRSSRYLKNMVERDHQGVKSRIKPMLGFKIFDCAAATIAGVESLHRIPQRPVQSGSLAGERASRACDLERGPLGLNVVATHSGSPSASQNICTRTQARSAMELAGLSLTRGCARFAQYQCRLHDRPRPGRRSFQRCHIVRYRERHLACLHLQHQHRIRDMPV